MLLALSRGKGLNWKSSNAGGGGLFRCSKSESLIGLPCPISSTNWLRLFTSTISEIDFLFTNFSPLSIITKSLDNCLFQSILFSEFTRCFPQDIVIIQYVNMFCNKELNVSKCGCATLFLWYWGVDNMSPVLVKELWGIYWLHIRLCG